MSTRASSAESSTRGQTNIPDPNPNPNPNRHICPICSKAFSSVQALGGHQNAHRKERAQQTRQRLESLRLFRDATVFSPPPPPARCFCSCTGACGYFGQKTEIARGGERTEKPLSLELTLAVGGSDESSTVACTYSEAIFPVSDFMQTGLDLDLKL